MKVVITGKFLYYLIIKRNFAKLVPLTRHYQGDIFTKLVTLAGTTAFTFTKTKQKKSVIIKMNTQFCILWIILILMLKKRLNAFIAI